MDTRPQAEGFEQPGPRHRRSLTRRRVVTAIIALALVCALVSWYLSVRQRMLKEIYSGLRWQCLKRIHLGLMNYRAAKGTFPPAYLADPDGRPMHSWRVLILPYCEGQEFYDQYDFSEPWDSPHNLQLARSDCPLAGDIQSPGDPGAEHGWTSILAVVGPGTLLTFAQVVNVGRPTGARPRASPRWTHRRTTSASINMAGKSNTHSRRVATRRREDPARREAEFRNSLDRTEGH